MPSLAQTLRGGIAFNELLIDPTGTAGVGVDSDRNGTAANWDEFVELYNCSDQSITLDGLELWDRGQGRWFTFPTGSVLAPGRVAVVLAGLQAGGQLPAVSDGNLAFEAGRSGTASTVLNNDSDNVVLFDPLSGDYLQLRYGGAAADDPVTDYGGFSVLAQRVGIIEDWGTDIDGRSLARSPDGTGPIQVTFTPNPTAGATPGQDNDGLVVSLEPGTTAAAGTSGASAASPAPPVDIPMPMLLDTGGTSWPDGSVVPLVLGDDILAPSAQTLLLHNSGSRDLYITGTITPAGVVIRRSRDHIPPGQAALLEVSRRVNTLATAAPSLDHLVVYTNAGIYNVPVELRAIASDVGIMGPLAQRPEPLPGSELPIS
jgi:hypothetical protein